MNKEFPFSVKLSNKKIVNFRKWKVKDRKAFKKILKDENAQEKDIANVLVRPCLETNIVLSPDEMQYVLIELRKKSIGENINWSYICDCEASNKELVALDDINIPHLADWKNVSVNTVEFKFGDILNKEMYEAAIDLVEDIDELNYIDLAFHIHEIGDNIDFNVNDIIEYIDEMEVNDIDELFKAYNEMKFYTTKIKEFTCQECKKSNKFEFDTIPEFFPDTWI